MTEPAALKAPKLPEHLERGIYRKEALDDLVKPPEEFHVLDLTPTWTRWAYWLVVTICSAALSYSFMAWIDEYATGTAILHQDGRSDITARSAGVVEQILVRPGQRVHAGQELMRLHAEGETADLLRTEKEFELQLIRTLRDQGDVAARAALTSLRAQKELAEARLADRSVRARADGVVSDIRLRPGQRVEPGEVTISLMSNAGRFRVIAVLPGEYRPLLRRGMTMRLTLRGFPYRYHDVHIDAVGDEVVGANEVRRALGPTVADTFTPEGALVLVEGHLADPEFVIDGHRLAYFDGMQGTAEVAVRSERVIVALIPALEAIFGYHDGE
jgi:membrane fusion protein (multidrug efflux system)